MDLDALKRIYFIGIGGIGMSALARYFNTKGCQIFGYDKTETVLTKKLVSEGMEIHYEDNILLIPESIDMVIYTPAIPKEHTEWNYLLNSNIPLLKRSEVLGLISKSKKCIAVAGTHGKTTTSSMTAYLLKQSGLDISCFLGGIANNFNSNYCYGENEWTVIEADEFDRSFHTLSPEIAVLISMDPDHLDIYGAKEKMQESFEIFLSKVNDGGKIIVHEDLIGLFENAFLKSFESRGISIFRYGIKNGEFCIKNIEFSNGIQSFDFYGMDDIISGLEMKMPGEHNVVNMCSAIAVSKLIGVENKKIRAGVKTFSGIKRRFDIFKSLKDIIYVDDYAHHPNELKAAIGSARKLWPDKKLTIIFQPHLFSRTIDFIDDFAIELAKVDELILMEIYPAREKPIKGVNSQLLLDKIKLANKTLVQDKDLMEFVKHKEIEILMTLGAGDIDVFVPKIRDWIEKND